MIIITIPSSDCRHMITSKYWKLNTAFTSPSLSSLSVVVTPTIYYGQILQNILITVENILPDINWPVRQHSPGQEIMSWRGFDLHHFSIMTQHTTVEVRVVTVAVARWNKTYGSGRNTNYISKYFPQANYFLVTLANTICPPCASLAKLVKNISASTEYQVTHKVESSL